METLHEQPQDPTYHQEPTICRMTLRTPPRHLMQAAVCFQHVTLAVDVQVKHCSCSIRWCTLARIMQLY
jgi:hypothetical protein